MKKGFLLPALLLLCSATMNVACHKSSNDTSGGGGGNGSGDNQPPVDPPVENTIGFFLNDWTPKTFTVPSYTDAPVPTVTPTTYVVLDGSNIITKVPVTIFGHNSNIWMGQYITEPVLMNHIRNLKPNIIRFPGGSLSDIFFWNAQKGQKPADAPDSLLDDNGNKVSAGYWYGMNPESWTFSVDNYYNMLQQTGNEGLITINYGYARYGIGPNPVAQAAHLAADWVRYDNGRTRYWEIGNECNGTWEAGYRINTATNHDGQPAIVTGDLYGQHVKVFIDSMRKAAQEIGKTIYIGAYILEKAADSWQTSTDKGWNTGLFAQTANKPDFYVIHSYYTPYKQNATASAIMDSASSNTAAMMRYIKGSMTAAGVTVKPVAMDEWNIFSEGAKQQVSYINGMHAAILLGEALKNKYGMTSRWDFANGWDNGNDHGLFNIGDEPGASKWNPRPAFYYMYYFQKMIGDRLLNTTVLGDVLAYGSSFTSGEKGVILVNKNTTERVVQLTLKNITPGARFYWYTLTGGGDNGEFSLQVAVNGTGPAESTGGPAAYYTTIKAYSASTQNGVKVFMPARSVVYLVMDK